MSDSKYPATETRARATQPNRRDLGALRSGSKLGSWSQSLAKPRNVVAAAFSVVLLGLVWWLQQDPGALLLETPEARYELLQNEGLTAGVPIAVRLGPLALFEISDSMAGGAGATRARRVVENLNLAVVELEATPGRVITIETDAESEMPRIVQKATSTASESLEIVQVTSDDLVLAETDDAKLLARVWAERLTDSLRLLIFGEPPEFSRDTEFGRALDTLYVNARSHQDRGLTTAAIDLAFEELPQHLQRALATPSGPPPLAQD